MDTTQIKNLRMAKMNPQMILGQMLPANVQQAIQYVNECGGNAKEAFYKLANEQGIDPETLIE